MIDTDKYEGQIGFDDVLKQIEFDDVLKEIEVGVDISEGNYDILRYYRDEYKDLLAEVKRLREQNKLMVDYFRFMRDGGFTDADWVTVNEWIGEEEE